MFHSEGTVPYTLAANYVQDEQNDFQDCCYLKESVSVEIALLSTHESAVALSSGRGFILYLFLFFGEGFFQGVPGRLVHFRTQVSTVSLE